MSKPPLPPEAEALLAEPNPCVIATLRSDGTPVTTPTWYLWEDGQVLVNMDEARVRLRHLRNDPRVSLTVLDRDWYTHVTSSATSPRRTRTRASPTSTGSPGTTPASPTPTASGRGSAPGSGWTAGTAGAR